MSSYASYVAETMITLVVVCVLMYGVLVFAKRFGIGRPKGPIELVGQLPLDARRAIYLVRVAEQVLVVGASEAGLTRLGELGKADVDKAKLPEAPKANFRDLLGMTQKERTKADDDGVAEAKDQEGDGE